MVIPTKDYDVKVLSIKKVENIIEDQDREYFEMSASDGKAVNIRIRSGLPFDGFIPGQSLISVQIKNSQKNLEDFQTKPRGRPKKDE